LKKKILLKKIVPWPASLLIRFLCGTTRIRQYPGQLGHAYAEENRPFIAAFWHSRLLFAGWYLSDFPTCAMISRHSDGELAAATYKKLGIEAARGSTTEGGMPALRQLVQSMKQGQIAAITPDGPRGPARRLQDGVISLGQLSQRPIIPVSFSSRYAVRLKSWDRFLVPMPFSRSSLVYGEPIMIPRKLDAAAKEDYRIRVEAELNRVTDLSDDMVGRPKI
jgi:lysophospholipid acyltransferase (LPLAT)-like uncharacterized protein